jgi:hypothetical protein
MEVESMRSFLADATDRADVSEQRHDVSDFSASGDRAPPAPLAMFARLGLLLAIAVGFGLAAQLVVGMSH